jgi:uncharacterized RDD family membrane protein YckC
MTAVVPATLLRRLAATVYDGLLLTALWMATTLLTVVITDLIGAPRPPELLRALLMLVALAFFGWSWTHGGQTLGGRAWKLRVERIDERPMNWPTAMLRVALGVTWIPLGMIWCLSSADRRALHDVLSGTRVVRVLETRR